MFENRPVRIRHVSRAEAEKLGLRKLPPADRDELRLIEIADFDLSACGGTHVGATGQIGSILLRKTEKVRQGTRVEFVCGNRAVRMARRDFSALTEAAALFSAQLWDVPEQIRKSLEESKLLRKQKDDALDQLAELMALADSAESAGDERAENHCAGVFRSRHRLRQTVCPESDASGNAGHRAGGEHAWIRRAWCLRRLPGGGQPTWARCSSKCCRPSEAAAVAAAISPRAEFRRARFNIEQLLRQAAVTIGA